MNVVTYNGQKFTEDELNALSLSQSVAFYNKIAAHHSKTTVRSFRSKPDAVRRIMLILREHGEFTPGSVEDAPEAEAKVAAPETEKRVVRKVKKAKKTKEVKRTEESGAEAALEKQPAEEERTEEEPSKAARKPRKRLLKKPSNGFDGPGCKTLFARNSLAGDKNKVPKNNTKRRVVFDLARRPEGVSFDEIRRKVPSWASNQLAIQQCLKIIIDQLEWPARQEIVDDELRIYVG